jgi:hypothetical protein
VFFPPRNNVTRFLRNISAATVFIVGLTLIANAQESGRIKGTVKVPSGTPAAGFEVVITNQVTRRIHRTRSRSDGSYSIRLPPGAYRIALAPPNVAQFDKDKNYGDFAIPKGDTLENVIVEPGKDVVIDIVIAPPSPAAAAQVPDRRESPDRWRIIFRSTIATAIAARVVVIFPSKRGDGGIPTIKVFLKVITRLKAISCSWFCLR